MINVGGYQMEIVCNGNCAHLGQLAASVAVRVGGKVVETGTIKH